METITNGDVFLPEADLEHVETQHRGGLLSNLNKLRKENQLCDAILVIGGHEMPIHRAVVAASCSYLLELFKKDKKEGQTAETQNMYKLKDIDFESFQYLLDYIYTGRLSVPGPEVKAVYKAAVKLKIVDAAKTCSKFLAANLSVANCLGVRRFAVDNDLREKTDLFIQNNINNVTCCKLFFGLPTVQVEIIGADDDLIEPSNNRHMIELVLSWAKSNLDIEKPRLDDLTEQVNILYLNPDNTLTDFIDINDERTKEEEIVKDYKCKKRQIPHQKDFVSKGHLKGNVRKFSINPENPVSPMEWSVIADCQTKDKTFLSVCIMNNDLAVLSIHCRAKTHSPADSGSEAPDSPTSSTVTLDRAVSLTPLANMSVPRCGFGLKVMNGQLFACGGYDRAECLKSTELYDCKTNKWSLAADMCFPRGRFCTENVNGVIYAVGGSNGHVEQKPVECYDSENSKWFTVSQVETAKVSQALVCANGKLFCIGGCVGQRSVPDCHVFDPEKKSWSDIAPLTKGRYQIAACFHDGFIYAIGGTGTDGWVCSSVTEMYDIEEDKWLPGPSLNVGRRGAGCDILNGKIYVVGGSDGSHSLKSVEVLESNSFILGPQMSIGRANVGVVAYSNRLYAVGGFSGKKFLDTFEYLDAKSEEWCSYMPVDEGNNHRTENDEDVDN